jgi:hypothetical protein
MPALVQAMSASWKTWWEDLSAQHVILDETGRAVIMSQNWYWNAIQSLSSDPGFYYDRESRQRFIKLDDLVIIRFKLFDGRLKTSNYPTWHARRWESQGTLPGLPGLPQVARLNLGYRVDETGTRIEDAFLTLPNGEDQSANDWIWQVWGSPIDLSTFGLQFRLGQAGQVLYDYDDYAQYGS